MRTHIVPFLNKARHLQAIYRQGRAQAIVCIVVHFTADEHLRGGVSSPPTEAFGIAPLEPS